MVFKGRRYSTKPLITESRYSRRASSVTPHSSKPWVYGRRQALREAWGITGEMVFLKWPRVKRSLL